MPNPRNGDLPTFQLRKNRRAMRTGALGEPAFPDELLKKSARVEMLGRRQILERTRQLAARRHGTAGGWFGHGAETLALVTRSTNLKIKNGGNPQSNMLPNSILGRLVILHLSCVLEA